MHRHRLVPIVLSLLLGGPFGCEDEVVEDSIPKADAAADQKSDALSEGHGEAAEASSLSDTAVSDTSESADGDDGAQ